MKYRKLLFFLFVTLLAVLSVCATRNTVFIPKHEMTDTLSNGEPKRMEFTATATEFRPIPDTAHSKKDFYSHRYHFMNFVKATTPYPTFRATAIRNYRTGEFTDRFFDIIKAAYDVGFGSENILVNIAPQKIDFKGNTTELTEVFKRDIEQFIRNLNGNTEIQGVKFKVKYWEMGNELDYVYENKRVYGPNLTDEQLYVYWQYLYTKIKEEIPDAVVLSNSFYYVGVKAHTNKRMLSYINHQYPNGKHVYDFFDVFNFHYYHHDLSPQYIGEMVDNARELWNKPVWITELGCGNTEEEHARRFPVLNILAAAHGCERTLVYKMFNAVGTEGDNFSLIKSFDYDNDNMSLKNVKGEGFKAERFFCEICGQGCTRPVISENRGVFYAYWESPKYGGVYAIWCDKGNKKIEIDCGNDCGKVKLYNYQGTLIKQKITNKVSVGEKIIYLTNCLLLKVL